MVFVEVDVFLSFSCFLDVREESGREERKGGEVEMG